MKDVGCAKYAPGVEKKWGPVRDMLRKDLSQVAGQKDGEVFVCAYARLLRGCGNTIHCTGCTISRTVMHTHENDQSHTRVPAELSWENEGQVQQTLFLISTKKVQDVVRLRTDRVGRWSETSSPTYQAPTP